MTKKNYEAAATIVQELQRAGRSVGAVALVRESFAELFANDNPKFDAARFRRACVQGANVKARS